MTYTGTGATSAALDTAIVDTFRTGLSGSLLQSGDPEYDSARRVWNGMIDKHPALIARCSGVADVVQAVRFAREHGLSPAVRGGGHNVAGTAVCDDGLVIDLSPMKEISVDPHQRTAHAQGGVTWAELDRETQAHGLVTPGGQMSLTGIAGFTLSGGMGFVRRKWGLTCDNLLSVEIVTADGQVLTASESSHPDLFWAVRGGGGNFGIVTSFEFQLHPLGPEIYGAMAVYPAEQAADIIRAWRNYVSVAPDEVTCDLLLWGMPPLPMVPPEMHWAPVVITAAIYAGPVEEGQAVLQPAREFGTPVADMSGPRPYVEMQSDLDPLFPVGRQYYWKSVFANEINDETIAAISALAANRPSPQTLLALRGLGGAMGRVAEDATAYGNRGAFCNLSIDAAWDDPADNEKIIAWTRKSWSMMRDLTGGGVYLNFAGLGEENDTLARAGFGRNYDRLADVKRRYDPANLFQGNVNVRPK